MTDSAVAAALAKGLAVGLALAAPVGPISLLCLRRTLESGFAAGFAGGLGTATADALDGAVAAFGLTAVSALLVGHQGALRLVGGAFLLWFGLATLLRRPGAAGSRRPAAGGAAAGARGRGGGLLATYGQTFALTLTNPTTILTFAALFAGLGFAEAGGGSIAAAVLVAGVLLGSALWWAGLSGAVSLGRARLGGRALAWIDRACGLALMTAFGVHVLLGLLP